MFEQQTTLEQGSKSALQNYGRSIAKIANHFGADPLHLGIEQINDYLYALLKNSSPARAISGIPFMALRLFEQMMLRSNVHAADAEE